MQIFIIIFSVNNFSIGIKFLVGHFERKFLNFFEKYDFSVMKTKLSKIRFFFLILGYLFNYKDFEVLKVLKRVILDLMI